MRRLALSTFLLTSVLSLTHAQMWNGTDSLYGNEWIQYDQTYFKIAVAADGIYRIPYAALSAAGIPADALDASQYQLWWLGQEQPLYTSTTGALSDGDFLEFYGRKNRSELDRHLFRDPDNEMLNPWYSLFTDTSAYFLTWVAEGEPTLRYEQVENDLTNLPAKEEWFWGEGEFFFTNGWGKEYEVISGANIFYSDFRGEGFCSGLSASHDFSIPSPFLYSDGPEASLDLRLVGNANQPGHALEVRINGAVQLQDNFFGAKFRRYTLPLPAGALGDVLNIKVQGLNSSDRYWVGGAALRYARRFNLGGASFQKMELPARIGVRYLEFEELGGNQPAILLDLTNALRLLPDLDGGLWKAKLPAAAGERSLALSRAFQTVTSLDPIAFIDYAGTNAEFLIITHPLLFDDGQGNNRVQEYADYRASGAGGGYEVAVVDVQQLYEQFAYGLNRHPLSIRNFVNFAVKHWDKERYCFLMGKGREYDAVRTNAPLQNAIASGQMLVPSYGKPASDNLLVSRNGNSVPGMAVGRLAATNGEEIKVYLDKVQAMEANRNNPQTIAGRAWMKHAVHLGGAGIPSEQAAIRAQLEMMGREIESSTLGAKVFSFYKTSTDPIQTAVSDQIFNRINEGVSMITFFGHSDVNTFDFNIDNPENYSNYGKYPLMLSLGCYTGDLFTGIKSVGERFVFYKDKAAIAFGASRGVGFVSSLGLFARTYYNKLGGSHYGQGIGDVLRATVEAFDNDPFIGTKTLIQQFILHGDPAVLLHPAPGPDYTIDPSSVQFEPRVVAARQSDFTLRFDVINLGRNQQDSLSIQIRHQLPSGVILPAIIDTVAAPAYSSTFSFEFPAPGREAIGQNTFFVTLDTFDAIAELPAPEAELNNELLRPNGEPGATLFIVDNSARPVYPPNLALVGEAPVTLKASTTDPLAPERTYLLEIDTTGRFDSPLKQRTSITRRGGLIQWAPGLPWIDNTVYYWRISPDSTEADVGYTWEQSSFTYVEGSPNGWGQGHYWQWLDGEDDNLEYDGYKRRWQFAKSFNGIYIKNKVFNSSNPPEFVFNGQPFGSPWPWILHSGIQMIVIDSLHGRWMRNSPGGDYGTVNNNNASDVFGFDTKTPQGREAMINFIKNIIPSGKYVMLYSVQRTAASDYGVADWASDTLALGETIFDVLESQGAVKVRELTTTGPVPYIFLFHKDVGPLDENIAANISDVIFAEASTGFHWPEGAYFSPPVGPSAGWGSMEVFFHEEALETDSVQVAIWGLKELDGNRELIRTEKNLIPYGAYSWDLSAIDATAYPFLMVEMFTHDPENRTPPDLGRWRIQFEGLPELAVNPAEYYRLDSDTLQQGATFHLGAQVENIGSQAASGVPVELIFNNAGNQEVRSLETSISLSPGESTQVSFNTSTEEFSGRISVSFEINPARAPKESHYFNNHLFTEFEVLKDQRQPLLDATFDGIHIMDGDLVSASPEIRIQLKDENPYLLLNDTSLFEISIKQPDGTSERVAFSGNGVQFIPAESTEDNRAVFVFRPAFEADGIYELNVQAADRSGNKSGQFAFQRRFEVVTASTVARVLNYPNPFSTSTQFVYTLTGSRPPAEFVIRIMTVSGKIVREIPLHQMENIRIGTHRTEFAWDGTDEYGDRLANGVYLYHVLVRDEEGRDFESRASSYDGFFKNGIGKLVLLR